MAMTCDPIMVLLEDIEAIDKLVQARNPEINIHESGYRKVLIAERKAVLHDIVTYFFINRE